jgi:4-amino-4-deoxy-L-arabinose transferase-like glycosyltransferase
MLIYAGQDFQTLFIQGRPGDLMASPPYEVDSRPHLRLLNGSLSPYSSGLALELAGFSVEGLGLWEWPHSYEDNLAAGNRPTARLLTTARLPAALFFCASIGLVFLYARQLGLGRAAYLATGLYALHPSLLLSSRRAVQEGPLLFFGLLTLLLALGALRSQSARPLLPLSLAGGLTLASKHSGALYLLIAFAWLGLAWLGDYKSESWQAWARRGGGIFAAALGSLAVFVALSPALWNHPPARLGDLLQVRQVLLSSQGQAHGEMSLAERARAIPYEAFFAPPQYYEVAFWSESPAFMAEVRAYQQSAWGGLPLYRAGPLLLILSLAGAAFCVYHSWRARSLKTAAAGLLVWLGMNSLVLMANPLDWQRYYLSLYPLVALLAALGLHQLAVIVYHRYQEV